MRVWSLAPSLAAFAALCIAAPTLADDPKDPAMKSRAAREADAAGVRALNRAEAARVQERDARFAQDWQAWRDQRETALAYDNRSGRAYQEDMRAYEAARRSADADQQAYARARSDYESAMANWRHDVSACQAGQYQYCAR